MQITFTKLFNALSPAHDTGERNGLNEFANGTDKIRPFWLYSSFALLLLGFKLWVIYTYGNATPFWDQWDAEGVNLYKPLADGTLGWNNLFAPHNEHRIVTTRILALSLLKINQTWNPLLQMLVNAVLHVITIIFGVYLLNMVTNRKYLPILLFFSLILFALPFGWENTLAGFQAQFYFVLLFSFISLWLLVIQTPFSIKWWIGIVFLVLAFFSFASGVFVAVAASVTGMLMFFTSVNRTKKQLLAIALLGILFICGVKSIPPLPYHDIYKAHSVSDLYYSVTSTLGWPLSRNLIAALIINLPAAIFMIIMLRKTPPANNYRWFLAALVIWLMAQSFSIAWGRATINRSPRYLDTFTVGVLANFACLLLIVHDQVGKRHIWALGCASLWTAILIFGLGIRAGRHLPNELAIKHATSVLQETHTRDFLSTGDIRHLKDNPSEIPYPDASHLARVLSLPEIRPILPGNINPLRPVSIQKSNTNLFAVNGYAGLTPARADSALGSYQLNGHGSEGVGSLSLQFINTKPGQIQFDVAGFPLNDSMKITIEQNGRQSPISLKYNPEASWTTVYAKLSSGPFSIKLTDSSNTAWAAISLPAITGRLDRLTNFILSSYYIFIILGLTILAVLITAKSFATKHIPV